MPFDGLHFGNARAKRLEARRIASRRATVIRQAARSVDMLGLLEAVLEDGRQWHRGKYHDGEHRYCLIGGLRAVRAVYGRGDKAHVYLLKAANELYGYYPHVERFNDCSASYERVKRVIDRARELAAADGVAA
jgi:hypothetical protein